MKKGEIYDGIIERVDYPNRGIITLDNQKIIVKNGIPGQRVRFQINKKRGTRLEGRLLEVLEKSPLEIRDPVCSIFPACGGCMYQTMSYENQLKMKEEQIRRILDRALEEYEGKIKEDNSIDYPWAEEAGSDCRTEKEAALACQLTESCGLNCQLRKIPGKPVKISAKQKYIWDGIKASPIEFGYRNKMEFSFGDEYKDGPLTLGLHKKGSTYDVLTASDCKLVHQDMTRLLTCVLDFCREKELPHYHKMQHTGFLRHLLLRRGVTTGEILVHIITTSQQECDFMPLVRKLCALPLEGKIVGVMHIINDSMSDVVQSDETRILYGKDYFYETLLGLTFKISTFSFFQPNSLAAEVLYQTVRNYIGDTKDKLVFDLYSGTGTIAQLAASVAKEVIGVEIVEEAVLAARENALRNGLTNCRFIAGDVLKVLDDLPQKPDVIILDPPRDGIHPKALPKILDYGVDQIVYISCKASSFARDLPAFLDAGYRVERACCIEQFCQTCHVESIVLLSHKSPDSIINVKVEFGDGEGKVPLDAIAERAKKYQPKPKITYKMIQEYVEKKYGFRVHTAYIAEVKRSMGLTIYDAPNAVEELKQPRKHPPKEKVEAIKDALKYFEVI